MKLFNLLASGGNDYTMLIILGALIVLFIVMSVSSSKKRKQQAAEDQARKDKLCAGTTVITIGGIMGRVVSVNHDENSFVLDTEGTKMKFDKRAIYQMQLPKKVEEEFRREQEALAMQKANRKKPVAVEQKVEEVPAPVEEVPAPVEEKVEEKAE